MQDRSPVTTANALIGVLILAAIVVGTVALLRIDTWGDRGTDLSAGRQQPTRIDPALIHYQQTGEIPVQMQQVRAVAVGPDDRIYVGGDVLPETWAVHVFAPGGAKVGEFALQRSPKCLAVGGTDHAFPGRLYVGMADHVELFDAQGSPQGAWGSLGEKALLTSIATSDQDVFLADAGNKIVWRYDPSGKLKNRIGEQDDLRKIPGFRIVSPQFDLAVSPDGLLRVVNPLAVRIEAYTFDGDLEAFWGESTTTIEGFFGCCNPSHFAILPDGRFVTAEKGFPRVKVYDADGKFLSVVAGPQQLDVRGDDEPPDVAADGQGRILVLDPKARSVRIFEHKQTHPEAQP